MAGHHRDRHRRRPQQDNALPHILAGTGRHLTRCRSDDRIVDEIVVQIVRRHF